MLGCKFEIRISKPETATTKRTKEKEEEHEERHDALN
jgi:hypothetical protein